MINFYFKEWMELNDPYWTKNFYFYEQTYDSPFAGLKQINMNGKVFWVIPKKNAVLDNQGNVTSKQDANYILADHPNAAKMVRLLRGLKSSDTSSSTNQNVNTSKPTVSTPPTNQFPTTNLPSSKPPATTNLPPSKPPATFGKPPVKEWEPIFMPWMTSEDADKVKVLPGTPEWKENEYVIKEFFKKVFGNDIKTWHPLARQAAGLEKVNPNDMHNVYYFAYYVATKGPNYYKWSENERIKAGVRIDQEDYQQNKINQLTKANGQKWKNWRIARIWAGLEPSKDAHEEEKVEWFNIWFEFDKDISNWSADKKKFLGITD